MVRLARSGPGGEFGPQIERHPVFPRRINVHFVQVHSPNEVTMRTWERGSGITLACGTGACAVCVAGVLTGRTGRQILAHLPGGDLELEWSEADNYVYMTGPATEVFTGEWPGECGIRNSEGILFSSAFRAPRLQFRSRQEAVMKIRNRHLVRLAGWLGGVTARSLIGSLSVRVQFLGPDVGDRRDRTR